MNSKYIKILFALLPVILFAGSCSFSSRAARKLLDEGKRQPYDLIVVPGVPLEDSAWTRTMKGRIYWSKYLYDRGIAKNIMYSGSSVYTPYYEGEIMALYAEAIGISKEHIFTETEAEHSTENIYYSYHKALKLGFRRIALASDPFQTKSLKMFTKKRVSREVGMLPMVIDTLKAMEVNMTDPVISYNDAYNKDFISIKKRQGLIKRLKGTMGIKFRKL